MLEVETCLLGFPAVQEDRGAAGWPKPTVTTHVHLGVPGSLSYYISTSNHVSKKLPELPKNIQSVTSGKSTYIIYMLCVVMTVVKHKTMKAGNVTVFNWATGEGKRPCYIWTWAKKKERKKY